ncbi:hypothetical protein GMSM_39760 [Geomonas sp. Red276]
MAVNKPEIASSPAASGPAGSPFEAQVGAHYLLAMLIGSEPLGLPGTIIDRVEFPRAAEGRPLDDVIGWHLWGRICNIYFFNFSSATISLRLCF